MMGTKLPLVYFNGKDKSMPVDLFIAIMDQIGFQNNAGDVPIILTCLSDDVKSVVKSHEPTRWCDVKKILHKEYKKTNSPTILECLHLLSSLVRRSDESMNNYFIRVKFFVDAVKTMDEGFVDIWVKILFLNGLVTPSSVMEQQVAFLLEELERYSQEQEWKAEDFDHMKCEPTSGDESKYTNGDVRELNDLIECDVKGENDDEDMPLSEAFCKVSRVQPDQTKSNINEAQKKKFKKPYVKIYNTHESIKDIDWETPLLYQVVQDPVEPKSQMFVCAICIKNGKKDLMMGKEVFWKHIEEEHDKRICICDICDRTFLQIDYLALHRFRDHHQVTKGFPVKKCPKEDCDFEFVSSTDLAVHNNKAHRKDELKAMCNICGIYLSNQSSVKTHIRHVHEKKRDFNCDKCEKTFQSGSHLRRHRIMHDDPTFFYVVCEQCGKVCVNQSNLNDHVRKVHLKERNHKCDICGKAFFASKNLRNHLVSVHQLSDEFKCSHCGKCLPSSFLLKVHEDNHLRIRRYHCKLCDSWYTATHTLAMHIGMRHMGFTQTEAKKHENIKAAKAHEAYEKVADEDAKTNAL